MNLIYSGNYSSKLNPLCKSLPEVLNSKLYSTLSVVVINVLGVIYISVMLPATAVTFGLVKVDSINLSLSLVIWIKKIDVYAVLNGLIRLDIFKEISKES